MVVVELAGGAAGGTGTVVDVDVAPRGGAGVAGVVPGVASDLGVGPWAELSSTVSGTDVDVDVVEPGGLEATVVDEAGGSTPSS